jgi:hypothetical protein
MNLIHGLNAIAPKKTDTISSVEVINIKPIGLFEDMVERPRRRGFLPGAKIPSNEEPCYIGSRRIRLQSEARHQLPSDAAHMRASISAT